MFKSLLSSLVLLPGLLTWAMPQPSPSTLPALPSTTNMTTSSSAADILLLPRKGGSKGGFMDDKCRRATFLLSDADNKKKDPLNTIKPYLSSPTLTARCIDDKGKEKCSQLRLGECYWNDGGTLKPGPGGAFHRSCTFCRLKDEHKLECLCYRDYVGSPVTYKNEVDLNDIIQNANGRLKCFDRKAKDSVCPYTGSYDPYELGDNAPE